MNGAPLKTPNPAESSGSEGWVRQFTHWLKTSVKGKPDASLKEALEEVLEEHEEESDIPPTEEQTILKNIITFADRTVQDIMTPRSEIKAVEFGITLQELREHISQHIHTRIPVYNDTLDNLKGFIHIKDLVPHLAKDKPFSMAMVLRELLFVPPSMPLINLLVKMRDAGVHMAIVVDEYGGTDGLVTLEDVFEQIVGEIQDEHDDEESEPVLVWNAQGHCDVDATTLIETLDESLKLDWLAGAREHEYDTIGGLIFFQCGYVPVKGEKLTLPGTISCEILSADPRRIHRIRLTLLQEKASSQAISA